MYLMITPSSPDVGYFTGPATSLVFLGDMGLTWTRTLLLQKYPLLLMTVDSGSRFSTLEIRTYPPDLPVCYMVL